MKLLKQIAFVTLVCVCAAGCRTTKDVLRDYETNLSTGNYSGSTPELLELADKEDGSQLLWRLMAASSFHYMDSHETDAIRQFDLAESVLQKNDQTSVFAQGSEGAFAMLTNDRVFSYDGGGLDRIFTCVYRGIDFLCTDDRDNARVEFNRAAQYQRNWLYDRRKDIDEAAKKLESDATAYQKKQNTKEENPSEAVSTAMTDESFSTQIREKTGFDPATSGNLDTLPQSAYVNAYATHLTGVFRWINGDNGLDDLKLAAAVKPDIACATRDFAECEKNVNPTNQVWIWVEDGLCPVREEWRIDLPLVLIPYANKYILYAGMALPVLRERTCGATVWNAVIGDTTVPFEELENIDRLVRTEYDVFMRGALTREITRTLVRAGVQVGLGIAADQADDWKTKIALRATQVGVATWAVASTAADIRSWTALPKRVMAVRFDRPADGVVQLVADGQIIPLTIPTGNSLVFIRKPAPLAQPVVKIVTYQ